MPAYVHDPVNVSPVNTIENVSDPSGPVAPICTV
jgi:hypothetical protein